MKTVLALLALGLCSPAHAQFDFRKLDINRLVDTVKTVGKATREIPQDEEIALGRDVAARLLGAAPLVDDPRLQRYVNHVGRWLASQSERPDLPWQFGVLEAPEVNAFAVPGGTIFITRGLLARMTSEAELAGVLAHEIMHVVRKHHLKAIQKGALASLGSQAASAAISDLNPEAKRKLAAFGTEMYSRGLDKGDELEADRLGVVIAARGGYDPYGLPAVLQSLQAANPADSAVALMFKTHPAPGERLGALEPELQALDEYSSRPQLRERFVAEARH
jgi:beta-barrel assembly-enhancing protease